MPSGLGSPRSRAARAPDLGERSVFVADQRVGKGGRRRARQRRHLLRLLQLAALAAAAPLAVAVSAQWPPKTRHAATATVSVVAPSTHRQCTGGVGRRRRTRPTRWPATATEC